MSYATDDLVPLLAAQAGTGVGYRQGIIRAWNPQTAENTVEVDGALFDNLSILNTNEALQLAPGHVVGILTTGGAARSWAILGRLTIPGTPEAASALAAVFSRIIAASDPAEGTRNSVDFGDLTGATVGPSVTTTISPSGRALVLWTADIGKSDSFQRFTTGGVSVAVSGATTVPANGIYTLGHFFEFPGTGAATDALVAGGLQGAMMHLFTGLNPGVTTFTMKYRNRAADSGIGPVEFSSRELAVFAM